MSKLPSHDVGEEMHRHREIRMPDWIYHRQLTYHPHTFVPLVAAFIKPLRNTLVKGLSASLKHYGCSHLKARYELSGMLSLIMKYHWHGFFMSCFFVKLGFIKFLGSGYLCFSTNLE